MTHTQTTVAGADGFRPYQLKLYVSGTSSHSRKIVEKIKLLLEESIRNQYELIVLDVQEDPGSAESDNVLAAPTLIRTRPEPELRIIGNLENRQEIRRCLDLYPAETRCPTAST